MTISKFDLAMLMDGGPAEMIKTAPLYTSWCFTCSRLGTASRQEWRYHLQVCKRSARN